MSAPNPPDRGGGFLSDVSRFVRWYAGVAERLGDWYRRNESAIRRFVETGLKLYEAFPVALAMTSVTFARGGWSEAPLGSMGITETTELVRRLWDLSDEEVRCELDAALLERFRRDDHAALSGMVAGWRGRSSKISTGRQKTFEDALFAHKLGFYTLSIPALAAEVEGVLRDLTSEYGRGSGWIKRFNEAFGFDYHPARPPSPPDLEEEMGRFLALSSTERYGAAEEMRRRFSLLRINELYDHGEFSDPAFASSLKRHSILHGVFDNYGELESLRLFFLLELLHDAAGEYEKRVWLVPLAPSHLPVLVGWARYDPELGLRLSGSYAEDPGWAREVAEQEGRIGRIALRGGEPVGFVDLDLSDEVDGMGWLAFYVAPPFRSRGVGRRILGLASKEARARGASALLAEIEGDDRASERCLRSAGFEGVGREAKAGLLLAFDLARTPA